MLGLSWNTSTFFWLLGDEGIWFWCNKSSLDSFSRYIKINISLIHLDIDTWDSSFFTLILSLFSLTLKNQPDFFPMATKETGFHNMSLCLYQKDPSVHWISSEQVNLPSLFWDKEIRCICCACLYNCHVYISFSQWPFLANIAEKMLSIHWIDWSNQWSHHIAYLIRKHILSSAFFHMHFLFAYSGHISPPNKNNNKK